MAQTPTPQPMKVPTPKDGAVTVVAGTSATEEEIAEDGEEIVQRLHAAYLNLLDGMEEFQKHWDENPKLAFLDATYEGAKAGGGEWLSSMGDLFHVDTWKTVGGKVSDFAGQTYDRAATYSTESYEALRKSFDEGKKLADNPDDTIKNWAWWQAVIEDKEVDMRRYAEQRIDEVNKKIDDAVATVIDSVDKANKIYAHRDEILNLPNLIAGGDARGVQHFIDTALMDIDPELAKSIKESGEFHIALELIADHDSALNYMSYLSLMIEAVPPNFYGYMSVKYGVQLLLEVILSLVLAFLTGGAGVAARLTALSARLMATSAKVASIARRIKRAKEAIEAMVRVIEDFMDAASDLHALGRKLVGARARGVKLKGKTKETLSVKKELIKRDHRCRLCGSSAHTTPRGRLGRVTYD